MQKELEQLGLSEKEAKIYLASLELGASTADQLAKHAKIVRPTAYVQIKSLMGMGLMSTFEEGKKTYFSPESPSALSLLIKRKSEEVRTNESLLSSLLPRLTEQFEGAGDRPVVRFFQGKEGVNTMRRLALDVKSKEHAAIYSYGDLSGLFTLEERKAYTEERVAKGIHTRAIVSAETDISDGIIAMELLAVPLEELPVETDLRIWDDKVNIILYKEDPFGILIESKEMADSFTATFNLLWKLLAEKYPIKK